MGLMVAALLAALMSSLSSVFNSCSTLITMDIYKKLRPAAPDAQLVRVGRYATGAVVVLSILWIPFIRYLNNEIYQYLQSVQAYVGAPITATFLVGILWKGATARAAFTTLVVGGCLGAGRFLLDILHNAFKWDLGALNSVVEFSFLNYSVIVFFLCVGLMYGVSKLGDRPDLNRLTGLVFDPSHTVAAHRIDIAWTTITLASIIALWWHFA